jgi:hypothetical protein
MVTWVLGPERRSLSLRQEWIAVPSSSHYHRTCVAGVELEKGQAYWQLPLNPMQPWGNLWASQ